MGLYNRRGWGCFFLWALKGLSGLLRWHARLRQERKDAVGPETRRSIYCLNRQASALGSRIPAHSPQPAVENTVYMWEVPKSGALIQIPNRGALITMTSAKRTLFYETDISMQASTTHIFPLLGFPVPKYNVSNPHHRYDS